MPNYGHLSLSCAFIERPSPLENSAYKVRFFANKHSRKYRQKVTATMLYQTASHPVFQLLAQMAHVCFHGRKWVYTLGFRRKIAHKCTHAETGAVSDGVLLLLSERSARSQTSPGRVSERQVLPLLGFGRGCSQRTQKAFGTAMRLCASLFRAVAAPLGCVIFFASAEVAACTPCAQCFPNVRDEGWYHYPRRALRVPETPDGRLSKRLICRFLRLGSLH